MNKPLFVYNPATDTWESGADIPFKVVGAAAGVIDGKVYIIGGSEKAKAPPPHLSTVWEFVPAP